MERTMSMVSHGLRSDASRAFTAHTLSDKIHERELGIARRAGPNLDTASDTSSQRERKFANLLGGSDSESDRDASPTGRSVGHRLYHTGCGRERVKQERLREERERLLMREMAQMTQRPNITARAREKMSKGQHFADHANMWSAQRDHHLRLLAQQVAAERFADLKEKPDINKRSEAIVKSSGDYKGPVRHWRDHFDKFSARRLREEAASPPPSSFTPNINANAVRVDVERSITDRLYQEASARRERLQVKAHEQQARELVDPATGKPFFSPHSLRPAEPRPADEVSFMLHEESFEARRKREAATVHVDPQCTFKPEINPASTALARGSRKPLYVPRAQRLEEEKEKREKILRARSAEQPNVSGRGGSTGAVHVDEFLRRAQRNEQTRSQKLLSIRQEQEAYETRECTFHPAISRRSEEIFFASNASGTPMRAPLEATPRSPQLTDRSVASPANPSTARMSIPASAPSPLRAPSPKASGRRNVTAADEFAAVMAASGVTAATPAQPPSYGQRRSPRHEPGDAASPQPTPQLEIPVKPTTTRQRSQPGGTGAMNDVEHYLADFESQMYTVLEEWRKLEEV